MNKKLLLSFAVFATALTVNAQKRGVNSSNDKTIKAPRQSTVSLDEKESNFNFFNSVDSKQFGSFGHKTVLSNKRALQNHVDTSLFFDSKQKYATSSPSGFTIQPYLSVNNDSVEITVLSQTIHNVSKSKYTLNGVMLVLGSRNKGKASSDVNVKIYDNQGNVVAGASQNVPYTTSNGLGLYSFKFDKPFTTSEDLTFYIEGKSAYDTIRVYSSGAYRNLAISCNISGNKLTLVSPAPVSPANVGAGFWTGQEVSGVGIPAGTKIVSYNATTKEYTLSASATNGTNIVVAGKSLTFDAYKNSAVAEYYKFPKLQNNEPDLFKMPTFDMSAIHGLQGVGPTDGHIIFYPLVEYSFDDKLTASNLCLGSSVDVDVKESVDNPFFAILQNPILNKMAFYSFTNEKAYYHGMKLTTSASLIDTLFQKTNVLNFTYKASNVSKNDTLIIGNYLWKYGYLKPVSSPIQFSNVFNLSSVIALDSVSVMASNDITKDGKAIVIVKGGSAPYIYEWTASAGTNDTVTVGKGQYSVVVTDANGCTANASVTVAAGTASIAALAISGLNIYPNPVANELNVSFNANSGATIELVNVAGQVIATKNANQFANVTFDTAELNAGVYFINIKVAEGTFTQKVIKD